ncbi:TPA: hypothetical protein HA238_00470 [Candidatus Micrarchaeota archaeon]|nr:hypothetical protein [Candidatus Micrarchaeota archaeon]
MPVYALKLAADLKADRQRSDIAKEMFQKHGLGQDTTKEYLATYFPQRELKVLPPDKVNATIDEQLWGYRECVKNSEDWHAIVQRAEETRRKIGKTTVQLTAGMAPEQRRQIAIDRDREREKQGTAILQISLRMTHKQRSDVAIERELQNGSEKRSDIARKRMAQMAPKRRKRIAKRAEKTRIRRGKSLTQFWQRQTHEERKEISRRVRSIEKDAERSRRSRAMWKSKTAGQRKLIARKRNAELEKKGKAIWQIWERMTPEQRSETIQKRWAKLSSELRIEIARRAWESRKKEVEEKLARISILGLPELRLLNRAEESMFVTQYFEHFFLNRAFSPPIKTFSLPIEMFCKRMDYDDIKQECMLAILDALRRWDQEVDLNKLVNNSVVHHMYRYFAGERKYTAMLSHLEPDSAQSLLERDKTGRTPRKR